MTETQFTPIGERRDTREASREDVLENGYDEEVGAFVQANDTDGLETIERAGVTDN